MNRRIRRAAPCLAAVAALGLPPAAASAADVVGGSADWGVEAGLRTTFGPAYQQLLGSSPYTTTRNLDGTFHLFLDPTSPGTYDTGATSSGLDDAAEVQTTGGVEIGYRGTVAPNPQAHGIWVRFQNVRVELDGAGGGVLVGVTGSGYHGQIPPPVIERTFGELDLSNAADYDVTGDTVTWTGVPVTLTAEGEEVGNGVYAEGDPLDPISFTVELDG